jgi:hypothetical protein
MRLTPSAVIARAGRAVLPSGRGVVVPVSPGPAGGGAATSTPVPGTPTSLGGGDRGILDAYVRVAPSPQVAVDLFAGEWSSVLPEHLGVEAGHAGLFADGRIDWLLDQFQDVKGSHVLELGPLEGGHTFQLTGAGARVTAIEANTRAYLKCLVAKELLGMEDCRFLLGDFGAYLDENPDERFDMALASGVLYHSTDPLRLLTLLSRAADRLALWTHYYDAEVVEATPALARHFTAGTRDVTIGGRDLRLHRRDYLESLHTNDFCGGPEVHALWMERDDLVFTLQRLGYGDIRVGSDDPWHVNGPCILLYAAR